MVTEGIIAYANSLTHFTYLLSYPKSRDAIASKKIGCCYSPTRIRPKLF